MDTEAVTALIDRTVAAWGQGDAEAYGASFTADATYVTFVGTLYRGREEIVRAHRALFEKFLLGTELADRIVDIRPAGPGAAVVTSRGDVYKHGRRPEDAKLTKVQTYTVVREDDGEWRIAAFHNTKRRTIMERIQFAFARETAPV